MKAPTGTVTTNVTQLQGNLTQMGYRAGNNTDDISTLKNTLATAAALSSVDKQLTDTTKTANALVTATGSLNTRQNTLNTVYTDLANSKWE